MTAPATRAEREALALAGMANFGITLVAYRAGYRDGSKPPIVFRAGDPEPWREIKDVMDAEGDLWSRMTGWWTNGFTDLSWPELVEAGPVVVVPIEQYLAALRGTPVSTYTDDGTTTEVPQ